MTKRIGPYRYLSSLLIALILVTACTGPADSESTPVSLPTNPPTEAPMPLSAADLMAVDEFEALQQDINVEWDQFHADFDQWRATLSDCGDSAVRDALREFAVSFNSVTEQARDLPRSSATRDLAETVISAAEAEEAAFRQLQERWQPNSPSLFETIEQKRTDSARAQRNALDLVMDLQEELEEAADPERLQAIEDFSSDLESIQDDWDELHDKYADLLQESAELDNLALLARMDGLVEHLKSILDAIDDLSTSDATEDMIEVLQEAAEAEQSALDNVHSAVVQAVKAEPETGNEPATPPATPEADDFDERIAPLHEALEQALKDSQAALKEVDNTIENALDGNAEEDLRDAEEFADGLESLLPEWDAFYEQYNDWRRTEGGCNRNEVLQDLGRFNTRMTEISREVRDLPQSGYLLPMYKLLVEAAEREEGAVRALRNSWEPFTIDAFIAAERERDAADRLRRESGIALEELRNRT